jgi:hypothetical protein
VRCCIPGIPVLGRWKQEDLELEASLASAASACLQTQKTK